MIEKIRYTKLHAALVANKTRGMNVPECLQSIEFVEDVCANFDNIEDCATGVTNWVGLIDRLVRNIFLFLIV